MPCLSNSNLLHRLQYSQQRTYLWSETIHQWMCLYAKKKKGAWKDPSYTWMATFTVRLLSLSHIWWIHLVLYVSVVPLRFHPETTICSIHWVDWKKAKSVDICFWNEQRWLLVWRKNFVLMSQKPTRTKWQRVPFIFFTEKGVISPWQMSKNQK